MKRTYDSSRFIAFFVKAGLVAALAAVLLAPATIKVSGSEAQPRVEHVSPLKRASFDAIPLPPIPYLETTPWLVRAPQPKGLTNDRLLGPKFEFMQPEITGGGAPLRAATSRAQITSAAGEAGHASL